MADSSKVLEVVRAIGLKMEKGKEYLTELDQPIGDNDHGISLACGLGAMEGKLDSLEGRDIGTILKMVGMTLVSTVGGASRPLYGTAYMEAGMVLAGKDETDITDFPAMMKTAVEGVMQRGHATVEEATMLDAMVPSLTAMETAAGEGKSTAEVPGEGVRAVWTGTEHTKDLVVAKGRVSYAGERGLGHQDPGATSYSYMLETITQLAGR